MAEITFYWLTLVVAVSSPAVALCRLDPGHLHVPGDTRAAIGLATVAAGHSAGGLAGLAFATTAAMATLAVVQLALAALTLLARTDLRRRTGGWSTSPRTPTRSTCTWSSSRSWTGPRSTPTRTRPRWPRRGR
jgi:hypothetical protein